METGRASQADTATARPQYNRAVRFRPPLSLVVAALGLLSAAPAAAQDAFEIQVYDAETSAPGTAGFELHANAAAARRAPDPADVAPHQFARFTLEPHIGLARWCEAGLYIQTAVLGDGYLDYAGVKFRLKTRVPRRLARGLIGLALNFEFSDLPRAYDTNRYGSELRPVIDLRAGRFYASINPIIGIDLAGPLAGPPQLEPAARIAFDVARELSVGVEYYAAFGPLDAPLAASQQVHRLFGALDYEHTFGTVRFGVNAGLGYGFTAGDRLIIKTIFGFEFGR